tara:strand:+ start:773 stop:1483 length:711 start_codon:yes stop_codon:yes gene_type:complete
MALQFTAEQRRIAQVLGIKNLDSQNDLDYIQRAQSAAAVLGIQNIDSQNDVRQINAYYAQQDEPETTPTPSPETTPTPTPTPTSEVEPPAVVEPPAAVETTTPTVDYEGLLNNLRIQFQTRFDEQQTTINRLGTEAREREEGYQNQLRTMGEQQRAAEQEFARQAAEQQQAFETAQRVSASNMARGGQQTDYRLGGAGVIRGGTAGFRRRPKSTMPAIGAAGFTTNTTSKAKTLNV